MSKKSEGAQHSDGTFPVGIAEAATGTGVTSYRHVVGRQGTDPVGDFGNGRGVGAIGQVVVGQGMVIAGGKAKAGCEVTGIRG